MKSRRPAAGSARARTAALCVAREDSSSAGARPIRIYSAQTLLTAIYWWLWAGVRRSIAADENHDCADFVAGLLPIIGNLNFKLVIVIISFSYSLPIAARHWRPRRSAQLEYFKNARIVGSASTRRRGTMFAMLVMEAAFACRA